jgi:hypothetical protein
MTAQVIFLERFHRPDEEKRLELEKIQERLHFANIEYMSAINGYTEQEKVARKEMLHLQARQAIGIARKKLSNKPEESEG